MITKVYKRDGQIVAFDENKIYQAVSSAYFDVYGNSPKDNMEDEIEEVTDNVISDIDNFTEAMSVETINDFCERNIAEHDFRVAKAFIEYRYQRKIIRNDYAELMKLVQEKLGASNVENQNANMDEKSFGGRMGSMASAVSKHYALNYLMSPMARNNHLNNMIYTHDLDSYALGNHNCLSVPIDMLLEKGFKTRQCDVRPAKSISSMLQLVAVLFQIQSLQQFGGVSATHLDWSAVPYVRLSFYKHYNAIKDTLNWDNDKIRETSINSREYKKNKNRYLYAVKMTKKETYQAVEGLLHNLNTLQSRSGNQLPFSSINYGTCTKKEGRLLTKAILEVSIKGIGKQYRTSIFPCQIFQYMKGVNDVAGTPNYDLFQLALQSTAKRLYPNYANLNWSGNIGFDIKDPKTYFSTMG